MSNIPSVSNKKAASILIDIEDIVHLEFGIHSHIELLNYIGLEIEKDGSTSRDRQIMICKEAARKFLDHKKNHHNPV